MDGVQGRGLVLQRVEQRGVIHGFRNIYGDAFTFQGAAIEIPDDTSHAAIPAERTILLLEAESDALCLRYGLVKNAVGHFPDECLPILGMNS